MTAPRRRSGATAAEFALVVLPFLVLAFGVLEFGRLLWTRNSLEQVAVAAARCMGVRQPQCANAGVASTALTAGFARQSAAALNVPLTANAVTATANATCAGQPGFASVRIATKFVTVIPAIREFLGPGVPIAVGACFPNQP